MARSVWLNAVLMATLCSCAHPAKEKPTPEPKAAKDNPFLEEYDTPFQTPPFDRIKNGHFEPAFATGLERHRRQIDEIANNPEAPTFENTLGALDRSGELLFRINLTVRALRGAHTNDELEEIIKRLVPQLTKHNDEIAQNQKLFARVKTLYQQKEALGLTAEQATLLEDSYQDFIRGGADLNAEQKARLSEINEQLALLQLQFGQNILKETNKFELVLEKEDLAGLPEWVVSAAAEAAKERAHAGAWVFTLHKPSLIPFLQYSDRRDLREKMFKGYIERGSHADELDNRENIKKIMALRIAKAELLGYKNYAEFKLVRRMAKKPENVYQLMKKLWNASLPAAKKDAQALQALAEKGGKEIRLQPWDWWYYTEKLRKARYDLDDNELRPYFKLENVLQGAFDLAGKLWGIKFIQRQDIPTYHRDVKTYEVQEADGRHIGVFYVDYFPRASKRGGAWCTSFRDQSRPAGKRITPLIINVGNFTMPTADKPALLSFEEVTTLFHEFGHALHYLLADTVYLASLDNIRVDFVELPSQIMENWAFEPEVLRMYARHYQTGEPIPDELIDKITRSQQFDQGFRAVEIIAASILDMDWHMLERVEGVDVDAFEAESMRKLGLIPEIVVRYKSPFFGHIFSSDFYAAGYYSYFWAEVLDDDAYEAFKENGLFDQKTAKSFRDNILSKGGSEDPMILYKRFRGAEPQIEPWLKSKGFE